MAQETLFRILSRQPWWITLLVAAGLFWLTYAFFPPIAPFVALPFALLAVYIAIVQWRKGSPSDVEAHLETLRGMSWEDFSALVVKAYKERGYTVLPSEGRGYDFRLSKGGQTILLQCRRWKVNQVGAAPVRELAEAVAASDAYRGICLAAGEFSQPARKLTVDEPVSLVAGADLIELVGEPGKRSWWSPRR
jgi:restriction system protein